MDAPLTAIEFELPGLVVLESRVYRDERGFFTESWSRKTFADALGTDVEFVQDNHSLSRQGVLRGLHYQLPPRPQGKLVRVTRGRVWDVAVDIRRTSQTFGRWAALELSDDSPRQLWVPPGFAHGFLTLSDVADVAYKTTSHYDPDLDRAIRWDDPDIGIGWPLEGMEPVLSARDAAAGLLVDADVFD